MLWEAKSFTRVRVWLIVEYFFRWLCFGSRENKLSVFLLWLWVFFVWLCFGSSENEPPETRYSSCSQGCSTNAPASHRIRTSPSKHHHYPGWTAFSGERNDIMLCRWRQFKTCAKEKVFVQMHRKVWSNDTTIACCTQEGSYVKNQV